MKKFRFFNTAHRSPLTIFLAFCNLLLLLNVLVSCQRETTDQAEKVRPTNSATVVERGGCASGYCEFTVVANNANVTVEFCGDITPSGGSCNFGCNIGTDQYNSINIPSGNSATICVLSSGSVCIRNPPTATQSINVDIYFGSTSTPVNVVLAPGDVRCYHTNSECSATIGGC